MTNPRRRAVLLASTAAAVVALAAVARGGSRVRREGNDLCLDTTHYTVRTDHAEAVLRTVAAQQEALHTELHRRMGGLKPAGAPGRMTVLVCRTRERYLEEVGEEGGGSRGAYMPPRNLLASWAGPEEIDALLATLRHEGTHQFVAHFVGPGCPVWLNEGLAVLYEHAEFAGGRLQVGRLVPRRVTALKRAIAEGTVVPLGTMRRMSAEEWLRRVARGGEEGTRLYDQAWAMVHFLAYAEGGKYQRPFYDCLALLAAGRDPDAAWAETFGTNDRGFQAWWKAYVREMVAPPDADCRTRLEILGRVLAEVYRNRPELARDPETFRNAMLDGRLGTWHIHLAGGETITSDARDRPAALFRCPADRSGGEVIHTWIPARGGEPPRLKCTHHTGVVLETRVVRGADGETDVVVVATAARP